MQIGIQHAKKATSELNEIKCLNSSSRRTDHQPQDNSREKVASRLIKSTGGKMQEVAAPNSIKKWPVLGWKRAQTQLTPLNSGHFSSLNQLAASIISILIITQITSNQAQISSSNQVNTQNNINNLDGTLAASSPIEERASLVHDSSLVLESQAHQLISSPLPVPPQQPSLAPASSQLQQQPPQQHQQLQHHQPEWLLVQPSSQVRIKCELPVLQHSANSAGSENRGFGWIFLTTGSSKPHIICTESKCLGASQLGIKLEFDPLTGLYDLLINSVSYELNDGFYHCDYQESDSKQNFHKEYKLTVLRK